MGNNRSGTNRERGGMMGNLGSEGARERGGITGNRGEGARGYNWGTYRE